MSSPSAPSSMPDLPPVDEAEVARILAELDGLTGLAEVKARARMLVTAGRDRRWRLEETGNLPDEALHMVFSGGAGTGKTSVSDFGNAAWVNGIHAQARTHLVHRVRENQIPAADPRRRLVELQDLEHAINPARDSSAEIVKPHLTDQKGPLP